MSNKVYDILKWTAQLVLPALATFYLTIANIWGLPFGEQISGTIMALDTLLGVILGISSAKYNKVNKATSATEEDESEDESEE